MRWEGEEGVKLEMSHYIDRSSLHNGTTQETEIVAWIEAMPDSRQNPGGQNRTNPTIRHPVVTYPVVRG